MLGMLDLYLNQGNLMNSQRNGGIGSNRSTDFNNNTSPGRETEALG